MSQYYLIDEKPDQQFCVDLSGHMHRNIVFANENKIMIIDKKLNKLIIIDQNHAYYQLNKTKQTIKYLDLQESFLNLHSATHFIYIDTSAIQGNQRYAYSQKFTHFIVLTCFDIYYIKISQQNKIHIQQHLFLKQKQNLSRKSPNFQSLMNQQFLINAKNKMFDIIVTGFSQPFKLIVNLYRLGRCNLKNSQNSIQGMQLWLAGRCIINLGSDLTKQAKIAAYTLTNPSLNQVVINVFPTFRQKGQFLTIYQYDLRQLCQTNQQYVEFVLKPQAKTIKVGLIQNFYYVKSVHQEADDLYIFYSCYVKYQKQKSKNNFEDCNVSSYVYVYNTGLDYCRNIIDIFGSFSDIRVKVLHGQKYLQIICITNMLLKDPIYTVKTIKMNSSYFNPSFQFSMREYPNLIAQDKIIALKQKQTQKQKTMIHQYKKLNKNIMYCKIWEAIKIQSSSAFLQSVLQVLNKQS